MLACQISPKLSPRAFFRPYSDVAYNLASYKRGTGGRSSFSGKVVTIFGANGFLGRMLVNRLGQIGTQLIIPHRCDVYHVDSLKLCGGLGQILFQPFHLEDEESIESAVKYSNVVVNLIGRDYETTNFSFDKVHCEGARRIARICSNVGVETFIYLSALNASDSPKGHILPSGSQFLRSKAIGEEMVLSEFPTATIVRPSDMIGFADRFLYYFVGRLRRTVGGLFPLWRQGRETFKQPVLAYDVISALAELVQRPVSGEVVELAGPEKYRLDELVQFMLQTIEIWNCSLLPATPLLKLKMQLLEKLRPVNRHYGLDRLERECVSDRLTGCYGFEDLGMSPSSIIPLTSYYLWPCVKNVNAKKYPYVFKPPIIPTCA